MFQDVGDVLFVAVWLWVSFCALGWRVVWFEELVPFGVVNEVHARSNCFCEGGVALAFFSCAVLVAVVENHARRGKQEFQPLVTSVVWFCCVW